MSENKVLQLFNKYLREEESKIREKAMNVDLKSNPRGLLNLAENADRRNPEVALARRQNEETYSNNFDKMLANSVLKASNTVERTAAFSNLARHLAEKYGAGAMDRAKELLGAKQQ